MVRGLGTHANVWMLALPEWNVNREETLDGRREVNIPTPNPSHDISHLGALAHVTASFQDDRSPFKNCAPIIGRGVEVAWSVASG